MIKPVITDHVVSTLNILLDTVINKNKIEGEGETLLSKFLSRFLKTYNGKEHPELGRAEDFLVPTSNLIITYYDGLYVIPYTGDINSDTQLLTEDELSDSIYQNINKLDVCRIILQLDGISILEIKKNIHRIGGLFVLQTASDIKTN